MKMSESRTTDPARAPTWQSASHDVSVTASVVCHQCSGAQFQRGSEHITPAGAKPKGALTLPRSASENLKLAPAKRISGKSAPHVSPRMPDSSLLLTELNAASSAKCAGTRSTVLPSTFRTLSHVAACSVKVVSCEPFR